MALSNDIVLRPRFKIELDRDNETVLEDFERLKSAQSDFIVSRIDNHVFIKFPKEKQNYWSPQLHLEIDKIDDNHSLLYGLFGPNPTIWTLFMFLHFLIAGFFIAFGIWAYTNWSLEIEFAIQAFLTALMVVIWFALYFIGRMGKATGSKDMLRLYDFMNNTLGH